MWNLHSSFLIIWNTFLVYRSPKTKRRKESKEDEDGSGDVVRIGDDDGDVELPVSSESHPPVSVVNDDETTEKQSDWNITSLVSFVTYFLLFGGGWLLYESLVSQDFNCDQKEILSTFCTVLMKQWMNFNCALLAFNCLSKCTDIDLGSLIVYHIAYNSSYKCK